MSNGTLMPPSATHPSSSTEVALDVMQQYANPDPSAAFVTHMTGQPGGQTGGGSEPTPLPDYTFEEQPNGRRWVDGKIVYQKTIAVGPLPNNDWASTPHGVANIATMVDLQGAASAPSQPLYFIRLPHLDVVQATNSIEVFADATNINIRTNEDRTMYQEAHVTMLYTCTDR